MKKFIITAAFICASIVSKAQMSYMDLATVSALISANIDEYDNINKREKKGNEYSLVTKLLKDEEDKIKKIHSKMQSRMNSLFILLADADLVLRVGQEAKLIYQYQEEALSLAVSRPYLYPAVLQNETEIVKRVKNVITFFVLVVNSYGDIANMKVDQRRMVYSQVVTDLTIIRLKSQAMSQTFKNMDIADLIKSHRIFDIVKQDVSKVKDIIKELKF